MEQSIVPVIRSFQSVVMSTLDEEGLPFTSYAPFLLHDHIYYVFISDIATHAKNINRHRSVSLFFIEDESATENIFARRRISIQCNAEKVERASDRYSSVINHFKARFEMIGMLEQMQDFNLYGITPVKGEATFGFGEAYTLGGEHMETLLPRSGGGGHHTKKA